jgi:hypothetical protein
VPRQNPVYTGTIDDSVRDLESGRLDVSFPSFGEHHARGVHVHDGEADAQELYPRIKAEAVKLVRETGKSVRQVAEELDLSKTVLLKVGKARSLEAGLQRKPPAQLDREPHTGQFRKRRDNGTGTGRGIFLNLKPVQLLGGGQ